MNCNIPDLIELSAYGGSYLDYEDAVYAAYQNSFPDSSLYYRGLPIRHKRHPEYNGKPATFWHIISNGSDEDSRLPNLRRYETVTWPFYILRECVDACGSLLIWENERRGRRNTLLFCTSVNYLVVLSNRDGYYVFWTAYPVERDHTRNKLIKEYSDYMAKAARPNG